jgi:hypothetical protein
MKTFVECQQTYLFGTRTSIKATSNRITNNREHQISQRCEVGPYFCVAKTYHLAIYGNGFSKTWIPVYENAREAPKVVGAVFPNFPVGRVGLLFILAQNLFNFRDCATR